MSRGTQEQTLGDRLSEARRQIGLLGTVLSANMCNLRGEGDTVDEDTLTGATEVPALWRRALPLGSVGASAKGRGKEGRTVTDGLPSLINLGKLSRLHGQACVTTEVKWGAASPWVAGGLVERVGGCLAVRIW